MLLERYDLDFVRRSVLPRERWRPFPPASDRAAWEQALNAPRNRGVKSVFDGECARFADAPIPDLPATLYMEFARTGNRSHYEARYFERRRRLGALVMAECAGNTGRWLDAIADHLWAILSETTWCLPAHARRGEGDPLPSVAPEIADLFACETAMTLAETLYLLNAPLMALSPSLCERITTETVRRVIRPVEDHTGQGWRHATHNWAPWCASNTLGAAMYLLDDGERLASLTLDLMQTVDGFIEHSCDDGACNEGPGYWRVAAGALLLFVELLRSRSNGEIDIFDEPRIKRMGRFILDAHLGNGWFLNFRDARARMPIPTLLAFRYGTNTHDANLQAFGLLDTEEQHLSHFRHPLTGAGLSHSLRRLFWMPPTLEPQEVAYAPCAWYPTLQVMVSRENPKGERGLILGVLAGDNGGNHNHNDIGHVTVFLDGAPGVVDVGVGEYTQKTFGADRYGIWTLRGAGHNAPVINGAEQGPGAQFAAKYVACKQTPDRDSLEMELVDAYPENSELVSLKRTATLDREASRITVRDAFRMRAGAPELILNLYAPRPVTQEEKGKLAIATSPRRLLIAYSPDKLAAHIAPVPLDDAKLREVWGATLWKITMRYIGDQTEDACELTLRPEA